MGGGPTPRSGGEGEPPSESPTTFSDCAVLWESSAREYRIASALGSDGYFEQAAGHASTGFDLGVAAASCDASAGGEIIEV